jgi:hypothetical protein
VDRVSRGVRLERTVSIPYHGNYIPLSNDRFSIGGFLCPLARPPYISSHVILSSGCDPLGPLGLANGKVSLLLHIRVRVGVSPGGYRLGLHLSSPSYCTELSL